jgi:hypothetical protein
MRALMITAFLLGLGSFAAYRLGVAKGGSSTARSATPKQTPGTKPGVRLTRVTSAEPG